MRKKELCERGKDVSGKYRNIISSRIDSIRKKIKNQLEIDVERQRCQWQVQEYYILTHWFNEKENQEPTKDRQRERWNRNNPSHAIWNVSPQYTKRKAVTKVYWNRHVHLSFHPSVVHICFVVVVVVVVVLAKNVKCNDISVIHVGAQMCRRTEVVPKVGLPTP